MVNQYTPSVVSQPINSQGQAPLYDQMSKVLGHIANSAAQSAEYDAKIQSEINKNNLVTQTADEMSTLYQKAQETPDKAQALDTFTNSAQQWKQQILEQSGNAPLARNWINHSVVTTGLKIKQLAYKQQVDQASYELHNSIVTQNNQISGDLYEGDKLSVQRATATHVNLLQSIDAGVQNGILKPDQAAKMRTAQNKNFAMMSIIGQYKQQQTPDDKKNFRKTLDRNASPFFAKGLLNSQDMKTVYNDLDSIDKQNRNATGMNKEAINLLKKQTLHATSVTGTVPDMGTLGQIQQADPDGYDEFIKQVGMAQEGHSLYQKATSGTNGEAQQEYEGLVDGGNKEADLDRSTMMLNTAKRIKTYLAQMADPKAKSYDPAAFLENTEQTTNDINSVKSSAAYANTDQIQNLNQKAAAQNQMLTNAKFESMYRQAKIRGLTDDNMKLLSNGDLMALTEHIQSLPTNQQADQVSTYLSSIDPKYRSIISRQIQRNLPYATSVTLSVMHSLDPEIQQHTQDVITAQSLTKQDLDGLQQGSKPAVIKSALTNSQTFNKYQQVMSQYPGAQTADVITKMGNTITSLATVIHSKDKGSWDDAFDKASKIAIGSVSFNSYNGGSYYTPNSWLVPTTVNGKTQMVQQPIDQSAVKNAFQYLTEENAIKNLKTSQLNMPVNAFTGMSPNLRSTDGAVMQIESGKWLPNANGTGLNLCFQDGNPMTFGSDKHTIEFKYDDIANPSSDFNKNLASFEQKKKDEVMQSLQMTVPQMKNHLEAVNKNLLSGDPYDQMKAKQQFGLVSRALGHIGHKGASIALKASTWPLYVSKLLGEGVLKTAKAIAP